MDAIDSFAFSSGTEQRAQGRKRDYLPPWVSSGITESAELLTRGKGARGTLEEQLAGAGLDAALFAARLRKAGVEGLFDVQRMVIPHVAKSGSAYVHVRDLLCSASTGSGKTLAYALPVLQNLARGSTDSLRCLVLLPSRDLAVQVHAVLERYRPAAVKVVRLGERGFRAEQDALLDGVSGVSRAHCVVATPGRLLDHMRGTVGFAQLLEELEFLVVDEADKLLSQSYGDVLDEVLAATEGRAMRLPGYERMLQDAHWVEREPTYRAGSCPGVPAFSVLPPLPLTEPPRARPPLPLQKLFFSATLDLEPALISVLQLHDPMYVTTNFKPSRQEAAPADGSASAAAAVAEEDNSDYAFPPNLAQHYLVVPPAAKPLAFLYSLFQPDSSLSRVLCFTKSVDSARRLCTLVHKFGEGLGRIGEGGPPTRTIRAGLVSSDVAGAKRRATIEEFKSGHLDILICSDALSRGLDLPKLPFVVSYDAPPQLKVYVHRIGRTARANEEGTAVTFVEKQEARHFKHMLRPHMEVDDARKLQKWGGRLGGNWASWIGTEQHKLIDAVLAEMKAEMSAPPPAPSRRPRRLSDGAEGDGSDNAAPAEPGSKEARRESPTNPKRPKK